VLHLALHLALHLVLHLKDAWRAQNLAHAE